MRNKWMLGGSVVLLLLFTVGQVFAAEGQAPAADSAATSVAAPAADPAAAPAAAPVAEAPKAKASDDSAIAAQLQTALSQFHIAESRSYGTPQRRAA